jgi:hypothetical protein
VFRVWVLLTPWAIYLRVNRRVMSEVVPALCDERVVPRLHVTCGVYFSASLQLSWQTVAGFRQTVDLVCISR